MNGFVNIMSCKLGVSRYAKDVTEQDELITIGHKSIPIIEFFFTWVIINLSLTFILRYIHQSLIINFGNFKLLIRYCIKIS